MKTFRDFIFEKLGRMRIVMLEQMIGMKKLRSGMKKQMRDIVHEKI